MMVELRKRLWLGVAVVVAAALAFAGPSIIAGVRDTAAAAGGCGMEQGSSDSGCGMDHGSSGGGCGMMGGSDGSGMGSMQMSHQGMAMVNGTVVAVDKRDGSATIKVKPASANADATRKALSQARVGDTLSMVIMLGKDGRPAPANAGAKTQAAKYACPMHPEVTSNKPGSCPKCGMNLERVDGTRK